RQKRGQAYAYEYSDHDSTSSAHYETTVVEVSFGTHCYHTSWRSVSGATPIAFPAPGYYGAVFKMMKALQKLIEELEGDASLHKPNKLRQRIEALDRLDAFNLEVSALVADSTEAATYHCAKALQAQLEAGNLEVYEAIRRDIRQGHGSTSLLQWLPKPGAGEDVLG